MGTSLVCMTYIIAEPCIYEGEDQFYIHPDECIDCGASEPECPVTAIFPDTDIPADQTSYLEKNRSHFD